MGNLMSSLYFFARILNRAHQNEDSVNHKDFGCVRLALHWWAFGDSTRALKSLPPEAFLRQAAVLFSSHSGYHKKRKHPILR